MKLNNRKVLFGIVETLSLQDNFDKICIIIDKIDKIGKDKFIEELKNIDLSKSQIEKLNSVLFIDGSNDDKIKFLKDFLSKSSTGLEGINEIENLTKLSKSLFLISTWPEDYLTILPQYLKLFLTKKHWKSVRRWKI